MWLKPGGTSKSGRRSPPERRSSLERRSPLERRSSLERRNSLEGKSPKAKLKEGKGVLPEKERSVKEYEFLFKEGDDIDSLLEDCVVETEEGWSCKACGVTKSLKSNLHNHIEKHIGGTSYSCPLCGNVRRTRYQIMCHISLIHEIPKKSKIVSMARQLLPNSPRQS